MIVFLLCLLGKKLKQFEPETGDSDDWCIRMTGYPFCWSQSCSICYLRGTDLGPVSRKSRKLFGPEKPFVKLRPTYSVKLVFSYVVKGIIIKINAKFRASRGLRFEDTKRIYHPKCARNVSGLSRNGPQFTFPDFTQLLFGNIPLHI